MISLSYAYRYIMALMLGIGVLIAPTILYAEEGSGEGSGEKGEASAKNSTRNNIFDNDNSAGNSIERSDLEGYFKVINTDGTALVKNLGTGKVYVYNGERAKKEFLPGSSFVLPISLFSSESYIIKDIDNTLISGVKSLVLDGIEVDEPACKGDITLREAYQYRCVGAFQNLAVNLNAVRMKGFMSNIKYGNGETSDDIANFWLKGPLRISCYEYLDFLEKLYSEDLPFSSHTYSQIKNLISGEATSGYALTFIPGYSFLENPNIAWMAGWEESNGTVLFFVMNMDVKSTGQLAKRSDVMKRILSSIRSSL